MDKECPKSVHFVSRLQMSRSINTYLDYPAQISTNKEIKLSATIAHSLRYQLNGSVKEPNKFHIYETEKITRKASDAAEYIELFSSFTRDRHARHI